MAGAGPSYPDSILYRIDISNPKNPVLAGSIYLTGFNALDIAIAPNGRFALLSDGRSPSPPTPPNPHKIAIIDLVNFSLINIDELALASTVVACGNCSG